MSLGRRITVPLFVLMACFSITAHAYDLSTFRLCILDPNTGVGRVLTDNVTLGTLNSAGDQNSTAGTIYFSGSVENFIVNVQATSTTANSDGSGGGVLTLSGSVTYTGLSNAQLTMTLEDSGYTPPASTAAFVGTVGGFNSTTNLLTPAGDLTGGASINLQSWLDVTNTVPAFGPNSGSTYLNGATTPSLSAAAAFAGGGELFTTTGYAYAGVGVPVAFQSGSYSMVSQATINFSSIGTAAFSLTGSSTPVNTVPEPTPLLLLGSALLGLGMVPIKKKI